MSDHQLSLYFQSAYREYRPDCSCGWTGSYWTRQGSAEAEFERHVIEEDGA